MNPKAIALRERTHQFFLRVIKVCDALPTTPAAQSIGKQLLDSAGSTDSNYRAACRARSRKEFIAKLGVALEEADESLGWLKALLGARLAPNTEVVAIMEEAEALVRIFTASVKTAQSNQSSIKSPISNPQ